MELHRLLPNNIQQWNQMTSSWGNAIVCSGNLVWASNKINFYPPRTPLWRSFLITFSLLFRPLKIGTNCSGPRVQQGHAKSPHESRKVAKWVAQSRKMGRARSQHGSYKVATWVVQGRNMSRAKSQHFFSLKSSTTNNHRCHSAKSVIQVYLVLDSSFCQSFHSSQC